MRIVYVMDPMCSWCWGFDPIWRQFQNLIAKDAITSNIVMGGLAPDSDQPMDSNMQAYVQRAWQQVSARTGASFNHDFWHKNQPRRSTWQACRAVLAAESILPGSKERMISAIQSAYYEEARNPSELSVLISLAGEIDLPESRFHNVLTSHEIEEKLQQDFQYRDRMGVQGFPALLYEKQDSVSLLSHGYLDFTTLQQRWEMLREKY